MKAVLFVDDERAVLDGLRFAMRRDRERWELVFVTSAAAALAELDGRRYDAIVSDLNMPEMNGLRLIERARERQSGIVGIILTGNVEQIVELGIADEVLRKPCAASALRSCIERWIESPA